MLIEAYGDEKEEDENVTMEEIEEDEEMETVDISLNSVVGITNPKTMTLMGKIGNKELVVMIVFGATNNFISNLVVQCLKIPCEKCEKFGVILGNGTEIRGQGICRQVCLQMQGIEVRFPFFRIGKHRFDFGSTVA